MLAHKNISQEVFSPPLYGEQPRVKLLNYFDWMQRTLNTYSSDFVLKTFSPKLLFLKGKMHVVCILSLNLDIFEKFKINLALSKVYENHKT